MPKHIKKMPRLKENSFVKQKTTLQADARAEEGAVKSPVGVVLASIIRHTRLYSYWSGNYIHNKTNGKIR